MGWTHNGRPVEVEDVDPERAAAFIDGGREVSIYELDLELDRDDSD